ncbi:MAG: hypothetical protein U1C33_03855 [Candidatus Cloacimonadaceae bacterium]|nr:hypothetical protein [Candidatus Cloacimonadaceae bacterium]
MQNHAIKEEFTMGGNMADINKEKEKTTPQKPEAKAKAASGAAPQQRITLIETIMILMLVGLVFVFVFPFKQMTVDKEKEAIARQKFEAILPTFVRIVEAADAYRKQDEFGAYPILIDELNLSGINTEIFVFEYSDQGPTITAVSQEAFGKAGIKISYNMATKTYNVVDENPKELPTVKEDWLP